MPLPTPRWVISSPSHMTSAVPAVIVSTMSATFGAGERCPVGRRRKPAAAGLWNRNTSPVDCRSARTTVT